MVNETESKECRSLTPDDLSKAMEHRVNQQYKNFNGEDIDLKETAETVLNFFGFNDRIIDNLLEPEERDVFYMLEDSGLIKSEREEINLYDGKEWRVHYWVLKKDDIYESRDKLEEGFEDEEEEEFDFTGAVEDIDDEVFKKHYEKNSQYKASQPC